MTTLIQFGFLLIVAVMIIDLYRKAVRRAAAWWVMRRSLRAWEKAWASRPRATITKVGEAYVDARGNQFVEGFAFDCQGRIPMIELGPNREIAYAGYTAQELAEITKRRKEFEQ